MGGQTTDVDIDALIVVNYKGSLAGLGAGIGANGAQDDAAKLSRKFLIKLGNTIKVSHELGQCRANLFYLSKK